MTSLLALITAVLLLMASRFLFSTVVSEHAVLLRKKRGRTSRTAVRVITCTLHQSWTRAVELTRLTTKSKLGASRCGVFRCDHERVSTHVQFRVSKLVRFLAFSWAWH